MSVALIAGAVVAMGAAPAHAFEFTAPLKTGDVSPEVRALENRIAGWFPKIDQTVFVIDDIYDGQTRWAVKKFQRHYGLADDGIAGAAVFEVLDRLEQKNGSTLHFDYSEFWQNSSSSCSRKANRYADTFEGGVVPAWKVKRNVKKLMWRLEAIRAKGGDQPIGINSAFRSVAYNECIGGASRSQHMYGTAVDTRMVGVSNRAQRDFARQSQLHGIGCYSSLSHNHLDLRLQNRAAPDARFWWWPRQDGAGRDLADDHLPCWGETKKSGNKTSARIMTSPVTDLQEWEAAGEVHLHGAD